MQVKKCNLHCAHVGWVFVSFFSIRVVIGISKESAHCNWVIGSRKKNHIWNVYKGD